MCVSPLSKLFKFWKEILAKVLSAPYSVNAGWVLLGLVLGVSRSMYTRRLLTSFVVDRSLFPLTQFSSAPAFHRGLCGEWDWGRMLRQCRIGFEILVPR